MVRKLPSLNALKAFEAAARHESLVKAAEELNVTHAAISRHVRSLERSLRVALFERTGRGVVLTEAGAGLARELTRGLDILSAAAARFARNSRTRRQLAITSDVPFATMWLVPRLGDFASRFPDVDLVLDPTHRLVDFDREEFDLGIRYGGGTWKGFDAVKIADVELIVVCSPDLLKRVPVASPAHLPPARLIQEQDTSHWNTWLKGAGVAGSIVPRGPKMLADVGIGAAEAGQGFALADRLIASDALAAGRLVSPFDFCVREKAYYLVSPKDKKLSKQARDFRTWVVEEVAETLAAFGKPVRRGGTTAKSSR